MNYKLLLILPLFLLTNATKKEVTIWGQNGHRVTGKIAENHLTKRAKRKIKKILNGQSLAFVSTYADEIKSDDNFRKYSSWHYVNMSFDETYDASEKNPNGDLVVGIETCISKLKAKNVSREDKAFYLKMLVHFIGDLHQPMHIGRREDRGGNDIKVEWFGNPTNLHSVWDTKMIASFNMSYLELANNAQQLSKKEIANLQKGTLRDWVAEVHNLTKDVYNSVDDGDNLRYRYSYENFDIVRRQLQVGGIRLAKVLNDIFK